MTETGAIRLIVMRHSKTEQFARSDHVRRLTERGQHDAEQAGRWMAARGFVPELVLVSSAVRARGTVDQVFAGLGAESDVLVLDELYGANPRDVIELCGRIPAGVECAAVVGHNPTMAMLVQLLLADDSQVTHFPTSAVAAIELPGGWDALEEGSGTLLDTHTRHDD